MPRWVKVTAVWTAVAVGLMILSRAMTVADMDDAGPPPMAMAQAGAPAAR